jgi:hypothetical protein
MGSERSPCERIASVWPHRRRLVEQVLHLLEQPGGRGPVVDGQRLGQLFDQFALSTAELARDLDDDLDHQVAVALLVEVRHTAAANAHLLATLHALGNSEGHRAINTGNLDLRAQCCLRKADWNHAVQVVALALKQIVGANGEHDVEVAARAARSTGVAFARIANAGSIFNAARHLDVQFELAGDAGLAATGLAWIADDRAGTAARAAGAGHGEESLLIPKLAAALALAANGRPAP